MADEQHTTALTRRRQRSSADRTAAALDPRSGDGWWVLHDLAVPGADHVVVTPGGVWVIASCAAASPAAIEVDGVRVGAAMVEQALATSPVGLMAPVRPLVCSSSERSQAAGPVEAVTVAALVRTLAALPATFTMAEVEHVTEVIDTAFGNRRGATSSVVRPAPQPPASPELPVLHPSGRVLTGSGPASSEPASSAAGRRGPRSRPEPIGGADVVVDLRLRRAAARVATLALGVTAVALALLGAQQLGA